MAATAEELNRSLTEADRKCIQKRMEEITMSNEKNQLASMIERMKVNDKPNFMLTDEEFKCVVSVGWRNRIYTDNSMWPKWHGSHGDHISKNANITCRIAPEYMPESEIIECDVIREECCIYVITPTAKLLLTTVINHPAYAGEIWPDGNRTIGQWRSRKLNENGVAGWPKVILMKKSWLPK